MCCLLFLVLLRDVCSCCLVVVCRLVFDVRFLVCVVCCVVMVDCWLSCGVAR